MTVGQLHSPGGFSSLLLFLVVGASSIQMPQLALKEMSTYSCGDITSAEEFNFVSPAYPVSVGLGNLTCKLTVDHGCPLTAKSTVCQLRLDFEEMALQPPLLGTCWFDKFFATGNGRYPLLCGENTGHHMYLDVAGRAQSDLTILLSELEHSLYNCPDKFGVFKSEPSLLGDLQRESGDQKDRLKGGVEDRASKHPVVTLPTSNSTPMATFPTRRAWKIKVSQIPCGCSEKKRAPDGCLQYHSGISGQLKSFNYDHVGCFSSDYVCDGNNLEACDMYAGYTGQLNNLDYTVCIEQEYGFCGTEYYQTPEPGSFSMTNTTDLTENFQDENVEGASNGGQCTADYIVLPGGHCRNDKTHYSTDRFCGNSLGVMGLRQPIISYARPIQFRVVTDGDELTQSADYMNRGYHLNYHQLPCSAAN